MHVTKGKGKKDKSKSGSDKKDDHDNEEHLQQTPDPDKKNCCYTCGKAGHASFKCPLREQIHQLVREGVAAWLRFICLVGRCMQRHARVRHAG